MRRGGDRNGGRENKINIVKKAGYQIGLSYKVRGGKLASHKFTLDCELWRGVVYIRLLPSEPNVCLYVGKTDNLFRSRMKAHLSGTFDPASKKYKKCNEYRDYVEGKEVQVWVRKIPDIRTPFGRACTAEAEEKAAARKLKPKFSKRFG